MKTPLQFKRQDCHELKTLLQFKRQDCHELKHCCNLKNKLAINENTAAMYKTRLQ